VRGKEEKERQKERERRKKREEREEEGREEGEEGGKGKKRRKRKGRYVFQKNPRRLRQTAQGRQFCCVGATLSRDPTVRGKEEKERQKERERSLLSRSSCLSFSSFPLTVGSRLRVAPTQEN